MTGCDVKAIEWIYAAYLLPEMSGLMDGRSLTLLINTLIIIFPLMRQKKGESITKNYSLISKLALPPK